MRRFPEMLRTLALVAGLAVAGSALAAAQSSDITGAWTFQTGHFDNGCSMTGQMKIARAAKPAPPPEPERFVYMYFAVMAA